MEEKITVKKKMGRPRKPTSERVVPVGISLSVDSAIKLDNYCDKTRMSRSKAIADMIEKFCSNNK